MSNDHASLSPVPARRWVWAAVALLVLAVALAYANSLHGPFVLDDDAAIVRNPTIRDFWSAWSPPSRDGVTVNGRPVVNVSLWANYALGGLAPRGYHVGNLLIHTFATLALFGAVRRTLLRPGATLGAGAALAIAAVAAGWWALHPLTTAAVTYTIQRAEALTGLWCFLSFYAFARMAGAAMPTRWTRGWGVVAVASCAAGMASKEIMAAVPVLLGLYDRVFFAGTWREVWRRRGGWHLALAATWAVLVALMLGTGGRGGTAGFAVGATPWAYLLTQADSLTRYFQLVVWPVGQVFDHGGTVLVSGLAAVWWRGLIVLALVGLTVWALVRRPALGFAGAAVWLILAPTSSFVPVADTYFEHRMYIPLALIATLVAGAAWRWAGWRGLAVVALLAVGNGWLTHRRNTVFQSEIALWTDTVAKVPNNVRAHYTLGVALAAAGREDEAVASYERALALDPRSVEAAFNLANARVRQRRLAEARRLYEACLERRPDWAAARNNYGSLLARLGEPRAAARELRRAVELDGDYVEARANLGNLLAQLGDLPGAITAFEAVLRVRPDLLDTQANLANALAQSGREAEAIPRYDAVLRERPEHLDARFNRSTALAALGRFEEALAGYEEVQRRRPDYPEVRLRIWELRTRLGR